MPDAKEKYTLQRTAPAPLAASRMGTLRRISKTLSKKEGASSDAARPSIGR
jgi:hypothetical protein